MLTNNIAHTYVTAAVAAGTADTWCVKGDSSFHMRCMTQGARQGLRAPMGSSSSMCSDSTLVSLLQVDEVVVPALAAV